jgi:predicted transcriptional regulator
MDTMNPDAGNTSGPDAQADRERRIAWEAMMITQGRASIAAGRIVNKAEVEAWIDNMDTDHELPAPYSGR